MKNECIGGGGEIALSIQAQERATIVCAHCGRTLKLRRNAAGVAAEFATIPRHKSGN